MYIIIIYIIYIKNDSTSLTSHFPGNYKFKDNNKRCVKRDQI